MVATLAALLAVAALYIAVLGVRIARRLARAHKKFTVLADLLEKTYGGHAEEVPETGEEGSGTPRRDGERGLG